MADKIDGVTKDACENFQLACDFDTGSNGRPKDPVQAAFYMMRAAEGGHGQAVHNLAALYLYGRGVPQDFEMARSWIMKSKAQGSTIADDALLFIDKKQQEFIVNGILPTFDKPPAPTKLDPSSSSNLLVPILFLLGLGLLIYIAGELNRDSPGLGVNIFAWVFGLAALGVFLNIIWAGTIKETAKNLTELTRNVALTILGIGLLASIGYCSGGHPSGDEGVGGVPDQVRSR